MYANKKSRAFSMLIFIKLNNAQHHKVQFYTEFHPNCTTNMEFMDKNLSVPLCKLLLLLHRYSKKSYSFHNFLDNSCGIFYLSQTKNVENMGKWSFMAFTMAFITSIFTKLSCQCFVNNFYTEFFKNPTSSSLAHTNSLMDMISTSSSVFMSFYKSDC